MNEKRRWLYSFFILFFSFSLLIYADIKIKGEISGIVVDEYGDVLPGASVILTGANLFQKSVSAITKVGGIFRFHGLNPGNYELEFSLTGFNTLKLKDVEIKVGAVKPIRAVLTIKKLEEIVTVVAEASLIDTKTPEISTNFIKDQLEYLPSSRNVIEVINAVPSINEHGAFGAGGLRESAYTQGSAENSFRLNGVDVSNLTYGTSWMRPNYDSVEEIQVIGVGASAEYGGYTGAVINVITKSGSNEFHGGLNVIYTNSHLWGDNNDEHIGQYTHPNIDYSPEFSIHLGGPLIKNKLFFFLAGGYTTQKQLAFEAPAATTWNLLHFQLKLDWVINNNNSFSFMFNGDPFKNKNVGFSAYYKNLETRGRTDQLSQYTFLGTYQSVLSQTTLVSLKYLGFRANYQQVPDQPEMPSLADYINMTMWGGDGTHRTWIRNRDEIHAALTQYADDLFGISHEFKGGVEYERSNADETETFGMGHRLYLYANGSQGMRIQSQSNWNWNPKTELERISAYFQDNIRISQRLTVNLGLRYDRPRISATGVEGTVNSFNQWSPRIGFSFDVTRDAKTIFHGSYGRYYDKVNTYGLKWSMPGIDYEMYSVSLPYRIMPDNSNFQTFIDLVYKPENRSYVQRSSLGDIRTNTTTQSDAFTIGFEHQLGKNWVLSADYIHKRDSNLFGSAYEYLGTPVWEKTEGYDSYTGIKFPVWVLKSGAVDWDSRYFTNFKKAKRRHNIVILTLKKRPTVNWAMMASFTFQDSQGNLNNRNEESLGLGWNDFDNNPNYSDNPNMWGPSEFNNKYQLKLLSTYSLPLGFMVSADLRFLSGKPWTAYAYSWYLDPPLDTGSVDYVFIEKRGSRMTPPFYNLNLRLIKSFKIGTNTLEVYADVFNVFNNKVGSNVNDWTYSTIQIQGQNVNGLGYYWDLPQPIRLSIGARMKF